MKPTKVEGTVRHMMERARMNGNDPDPNEAPNILRGKGGGPIWKGPGKRMRVNGKHSRWCYDGTLAQGGGGGRGKPHGGETGGSKRGRNDTGGNGSGACENGDEDTYDPHGGGGERGDKRQHVEGEGDPIHMARAKCTKRLSSLGSPSPCARRAAEHEAPRCTGGCSWCPPVMPIEAEAGHPLHSPLGR